MTFEEYVRQAQLTEQRAPRQKTSSVSRDSSIRSGRGGPAIVKPVGQTPFEDLLAQAQEDLEDLQEGVVIEGPEVSDPTGENPEFPDEDSFIGLPIIYGKSGDDPDVSRGGTNPDGSFNGPPPIGGHGTQITPGSGAGAGTGTKGRLYVAGEQINSEFGLGLIGAANVTPARAVPGMPFVVRAGAGPKASYVLGDARIMHVAGYGIDNEKEIIEEAEQVVSVAPEAEAYVSAASAVFSAGTPAMTSAESDISTLGSTTIRAISGKFATPFTLPNPAKIKSVLLAARTTVATDALVTSNDPVFARIYRGQIGAFTSGNAELVATLVFQASTPSLPEFFTEGGRQVLLPPAQYVLEVDWTPQFIRVSKYDTETDFVGATKVFDGTTWTNWNSTEVAGFYIRTADASSAKVKRIEFAKTFFFPAGSTNLVGLRLQLRSVFAKASFGVTIRSGRTSSSDPVVIAQGYASIDPSNFIGGLGTVDVIFDRLITEVPSGSDIIIDAFSGFFEVALSASPSSKVVAISEAGSRNVIISGRSIILSTITQIASAPVPSYGKNIGLSSPDQILPRFKVSTGEVGFVTGNKIEASDNGASSGTRVTGEIATNDTDEWLLFRYDDSGFNKTVEVLAVDPDDGSALVRVDSGLRGFGVSTSGRLGFSGASSNLRSSSAPLANTMRAAISPLNAIVQIDNRLFGAGRGLGNGWNAIPQLGLATASNPASSNVFQIISEKPVARDAWDLGGDASASFLLTSDFSGLWAAGRLATDTTTLFEVDRLTLISNLKFKSISCGYRHALLLQENGDLYGIGSNSHGQLGLPLETQWSTLTLIAGGIAGAHAAMNKSYIIAA